MLKFCLQITTVQKGLTTQERHRTVKKKTKQKTIKFYNQKTTV